ncbi:DNA topoisomerase I [Candidatus Peribacteria bacterium RIFCSPHIGHO2_01_FULL_51_9]|nr:MAG: DNA topoisomerase I [Candidatus Peribacteria bacterium RIFCSPHIGHO2_01_FULL_51_9]
MGKHLVIVESPTKAKTIKRFLGKDFLVEASMGHVRDLPSSTIGVDVKKDFTPIYEVPKEKEATVRRLSEAMKEVDDLWIATDEDREGEAIGWHLVEVLKVKKPAEIKRIVFHEITEPAIRAAVESPRTLDMRLVDAQQARRILDRLVGYTLSPFLWRKVMSGLSAGRVQSVAVRIIVDREREIQAFVSVEYWTIEAKLQTGEKKQFTAELRMRDGKKFVPENSDEAQAVLKDLRDAAYGVSSLEEKEVTKNPSPPFTTSTLQQEAGRKLGFSVKQTMVVAQQLYEGIDLKGGQGPQGLITYMRTDSVHLSEKALSDAKEVIAKQYGREYVLSQPRQYKTKAKGAQEAHEAIRPTELDRTPESLKDILDHQQLKLYTLIWNRTVSSQMPAAEFKRIAADIIANRYTFRATGQTVLFDGFRRVYMEGKDEPHEGSRTGEEEMGDEEKVLPNLIVGESLACEGLDPLQHFTKAPPRYTEASLVKKLEEEGIGRPSTYAPTISTVQQRGYITKEGKQLVPQSIAFTVTDLLKEHFPDIVNLKFTAGMEESLDAIAEGAQEWVVFLRKFYEPFHALVDLKSKEIKKEDIFQEHILGKDPETGKEVLVRTGRFGPYVQLGKLDPGTDRKKAKEKAKTAALPKNTLPEKVTLEQALSLLSFPRMLGAKEGEDITVSLGRFGPYIRWGKVTVALPKDAEPSAVDFAQACQMIVDAKEKRQKAAEPLRTLGKDPVSKGEILVKDGRYGPYITDGKTNASLGKKTTPEEITLDQAIDLLAKKRARGPGRRWGRKG